MRKSVQSYIQSNSEVIDRIREAVILGYDEGLEIAEAKCTQQAIKLSRDRIYSKPIPRGKDTITKKGKVKRGKLKWKRTGVYKASFYTKRLPDRSGFIFASPVVYATHLEYKCGYNIVKDSTLGQREELAKIMKKHMLKQARESVK